MMYSTDIWITSNYYEIYILNIPYRAYFSRELYFAIDWDFRLKGSIFHELLDDWSMTMPVYKHVLRPDTRLPDTTTCMRGMWQKNVWKSYFWLVRSRVPCLQVFLESEHWWHSIDEMWLWSSCAHMHDLRIYFSRIVFRTAKFAKYNSLEKYALYGTS